MGILSTYLLSSILSECSLVTFQIKKKICMYIVHVDMGKGYYNDCEVKFAQSCPTLGNSTDYTVHGILQARIMIM